MYWIIGIAAVIAMAWIAFEIALWRAEEECNYVPTFGPLTRRERRRWIRQKRALSEWSLR